MKKLQRHVPGVKKKKKKNEEDGFTLGQILNFSESGFYWNPIPEKIYISKEEALASVGEASKG